MALRVQKSAGVPAIDEVSLAPRLAAAGSSLLLHLLVLGFLPLWIGLHPRDPKIFDRWAGGSFVAAGSGGSFDDPAATQAGATDVTEVPITTDPEETPAPPPGAALEPPKDEDRTDLLTAPSGREEIAAAEADTVSAAPRSNARSGAERRPVRAVVPGGGSTGGSAPAFGAEGVSGVRDFGRAFARALPIAVSPDENWKALPAGSAGHLDLRVHIDVDGRLVADPIDAHAEPHWRALVARTFALLVSGRFALSTTQGAGTARLHLTATVSRVALDPAADASGGAFGLGFEAPFPGHPGHGSWTLGNGKRYEIAVRLADETTRPRH